MAQNERLISLDKAIEYMEKHKEMAKQHNIVLVANEDAIIKFLKEKCPTVDAVEVVRCVKCQYAKPYERVDGLEG